MGQSSFLQEQPILDDTRGRGFQAKPGRNPAALTSNTLYIITQRGRHPVCKHTQQTLKK